MTSPSPIIYQNVEGDITLIDIPTSIAAAQGDRSGVLLSTPPLDTPIEPKEDYRPRTQKSRTNKTQAQDTTTTPHATVAEASNHDFLSLHLDDQRYKVLAEHALRQIRAQVSGPWCTQRKLMTQEPVRGEQQVMDVDEISEKELEARMREWAASGETKEDDTAFNLQQMMASLGATSEVAEPALRYHSG
jgi:hypothetical protein